MSLCAELYDKDADKTITASIGTLGKNDTVVTVAQTWTKINPKGGEV